MARFRDVFAVPEYRLLWSSTVVSEFGDQLARVAVVVLVFRRTGSPGLTALSYALTYLPAIVGGPLLSGLADRRPRRTVMVGADVLRALLVTAIAVPALPLPVLYVLLFLVQMLEPPARAARAAIIPEILTGERYTAGISAYHITNQLTYVVGFGLGGVIAGLMGPRPMFLVDAATFVVSAALVRFGVGRHPPPERPAGGRTRDGRALIVVRDPALRRLAGLALLAAFYMTPPALAVPYAKLIGVGDAATGLLMAATPAGYVAGVYALTRWVPPETRRRALGPLGLLSCLPLPFVFLKPGLAPMFALLMLVGVLAGYQAIANAEFVRLSPPEQRGLLIGVMGAALTGAQGAAMALTGLLAEGLGVAGAIGLLGVAGALAAAPLVRIPRAREPVFD